MTGEQENKPTENRTIQRISFPPSGAVESLYYRKSAWYADEVSGLGSGEGIRIREGCEVRFDTWFNGFEIEKWRRYTNIGNVRLELMFRGTFAIRLFTLSLENEQVTEKKLSEERFVSDGAPVRIEVPESANKGILAFSVRPEKSAGVFHGGAYIAYIAEDSLREVNIALDICTYKREEYLYRNIRLLKENFIEKKGSSLYGHLNLYIQDNGQTLPYEELNTGAIHVVPNRNTGGSGGFTRGMLETLDHLDRFPATHILLMDDDVLIPPEAIERLYALLRCLKEEYLNAVIGGAMFNADDPIRLYTVCGCLHEEDLLKDIPLNEAWTLLSVSSETKDLYASWWFCAMPLSVIRKESLPMPFFIKHDDLEFALRNRNPLILMNGIGVWHEPFGKKQSPQVEYYYLRNMLFTQAIHFPEKSFTETFKKDRSKFMKLVLTMRYADAEFILWAARDFMKGIAFLKESDPEALNSELLSSRPEYRSLSEISEETLYRWRESDRVESAFGRVMRKLTLNGLLLPVKSDPRGIRVVPDGAQSQYVDCYRQKTVIYKDPETGKGFKAERDSRRALRMLWNFEKTLRELKRNEARLKAEIQRDKCEVTSEAFWRDRLHRP